MSPFAPELTPFEVTAEMALIGADFAPSTPETVRAAARQLHTIDWRHRDADVRDLRDLLWSSIDNAESRDLDQVEVADRLPNGDIRLLVGIADVDELVPKGSVLDRWASHKTSSIYGGAVVYPMLPEELSNDLTSLNQNCDRMVLVAEIHINADGMYGKPIVYRALVRNHAKLEYNSLGAWLEGRGPVPALFGQVAGLEAQIQLQAQAALWLNARRMRDGALEFETTEARPVVRDGKVVGLEVPERNAARSLIEEVMIAANVTMAEFLEKCGRTALQRIVPVPERWARIVSLVARHGIHLPKHPDAKALSQFLRNARQADPAGFPELSLAIIKLIGSGSYAVVRADAPDDGHFGLAVGDYTHGTAPNRRYIDIVVHRLVKAALLNERPPYSDAELREVAERCNQRRHDVQSVERRLRKAAAVSWIGDEIGSEFDAIVTGVNRRGTFVRLVNKHVEGKVVIGAREGMDVGERLRVKLISVNSIEGWIDFELLS